MKIFVKSCPLLAALLLGLPASPLPAQTLVTCGAVSTNVGAKLAFVNGANLLAGSGFSQPLVYQRFTNHFTGPGGNYCYSSGILVTNSPDDQVKVCIISFALSLLLFPSLFPHP